MPVNLGSRVVIVGGGAVGLAAGYFLQREGADVVILEQGHVGEAASLGNAGWITPMLSAPIPAPGVRRYAMRAIARPDSPVFIPPRVDPGLAMWLWRFWKHCNPQDYRSGLQALAGLNARTMPLFDELLRDDVQFSMWKKGLLFAFMSESGAQHELQTLQALAPYGYDVPSDPLDSSGMRQLEPTLSARVVAGFLLSNERHVDPQTLTQGLADRLRKGDAVIRERMQVTGFEIRSNRVVAALSHGERIEGDRFLLAAGAWTKPLAKKLGLNVPVRGAKGYSFSLRLEHPPRHPLYLGDSKIGTSAFGNGRTRVAGTLELGGLNARINQRRVESIQRQAQEFLSDAASGPIEDVWGGMRPLTYDGLPVVGKASRYDNVYLSTGHSMLGITLAPATGEAIAELMMTGRPPEILFPFSPDRFDSPRRSSACTPN